jgi:hypothetical protein
LDKASLNDIMTTCEILNNMIIEDDRDLNLEFFFNNVPSPFMGFGPHDSFFTPQIAFASALHEQICRPCDGWGSTRVALTGSFKNSFLKL